MVNLLLIGAGGFFGAISRYGVSLIFPATKFYYGTLAVNLIGCLLIGITFGLQEREVLSRPAQLLAVTGFLGGFTTFSTFGLDSFKMIQAGNYGAVAAYVGVSAIAGIALVAVGYGLLKP